MMKWNGTARRALDISTYQTPIDAHKAKARGVDEVVCRACYSNTQDGKFLQHAANVNAAGLRLGAYQFATFHYDSVCGGQYSTAVARMRQQADTFLAIVGRAKIGGFLALDMEMEQGQSTMLAPAQLTDLANEYLDILVAAGYNAVLYVGCDWLMNRMQISRLRHPVWVAYYYQYGTRLHHDNDPNQGAFPTGRYGQFMAANRSKICGWQFTSEGYAALYGCGTSDSAGLDKNWFYFTYDGQPEPEKEGISTMDALDVFANAYYTQHPEELGRPVNVQVFATPNVDDVVMNNLADGRYQVYETGIPLAGSTIKGVRVRIDGQQRYVAIVPNATEITQIAVEDAEHRWGWYASGESGVPEEEYNAVVAQCSAERTAKEAAEAKIDSAVPHIDSAAEALKK